MARADDRRTPQLRPAALAIACGLALAAAAHGAVTLSPTSVTVFPGETSVPVTVNLTFPPQSVPGSGTLEVAFPPALGGTVSTIPSPVTYSWPGGASSASTSFQIATTVLAPPGTYSVTVTDLTLGAGTAVLTLIVQQPGFTPSANPNPVELTIGRPGETVTVSTTADPGLSDPIQYTFLNLPAFVGFGGPQTTFPPSYPPLAFPFSLGPGAVPGTYSGLLRGTAGGVVRQIPFQVVVRPEPSFSASVSPSPIEVRIGDPPTTVTVTTLPDPGFDRTIAYELLGPGFLDRGGIRTATPPGYAPVAFPVAALQSAVPGTYPGELRGTANGQVRSFQVTYIVLPPRPAVEQTIPGLAAAGVRGFEVRLLGRNFEPGAAVIAGSLLLTVESVQVLSPGAIRLALSIRSDHPPGPVALEVQNPDGETSTPDGTLTVFPRDALGAPAAVRTAAIVYPLAGAFVGPDEPVYPRAVLATAGTGPLVVTWLADGVVFDRTVAHAAGGMPVTVEAKLPIPTTGLGPLALQVAVESPQQIVSEPVQLVRVARRRSGRGAWRPADGAALAPLAPPPFRWPVTPGAAAYEVEIRGDGPHGESRVVRVERAEWDPAPGELARLPAGPYLWTVRPVFGGGARGEASPARRVHLLPERLALALRPVELGDDGEPVSLTWDGGVDGLVYRVEVTGPDGSGLLYSALTAEPTYRFSRWSPPLPPGSRVRVVALAAGGVQAGETDWHFLRERAARTGSRVRLVAAPAQLRLLTQAPAAGAVVESEYPRIGAQWEPAVAVDEVSLYLGSTDVTAVAEVFAEGILFDPVLPLRPGAHTVRLGIGEEMFEWTFQVAGDPATEETASPGDELAWPGEHPVTPLPWESALGLEGTFRSDGGDGVSGTDSTGYIGLSGEVDLGGQSLSTRAAGDVAFHRDFGDGRGFEQVNRSWVVQGAAEQASSRQELIVGYQPPAFLGTSELFSTGPVRGGFEARIEAGPAGAAFYHVFEPELAGVATGDAGFDHRLQAGALELTGPSDRLQLRAVVLDATEREAGLPLGGEGTVVGLVGRLQVGPALDITFEGARSDYTPDDLSLEPEARGDAFRLGLSGSHRGFSYSLDLRRTEPEFTQPVNRGFTAGTVADRRGGDLSLSYSFGRSSVSASFQHLRSGDGEQSPEGRQNGGQLSFSTQIGTRVGLQVGGGLTSTRSDPHLGFQLPGVRRTDRSAQLSLSQSLGALQLGQNASFQDTKDDLDPLHESEVVSVGLSAQAAGQHLSLFGQVQGTRTTAAWSPDGTETLLVSLQPSWRHDRLGLSVQPYLSFNVTRDPATPGDLEAESYSLTVGWTPAGLRSLVTLQAGGDWSRTRGPGFEDAGFFSSYHASLTLSWDWSVSGPRGSRSHAAAPIAGGAGPAALLASRLGAHRSPAAQRWPATLTRGGGR